ncbi:MAG TPA: hypothetical protein VF542_00825, partial [Jatrophihabitans sp.]
MLEFLLIAIAILVLALGLIVSLVVPRGRLGRRRQVPPPRVGLPTTPQAGPPLGSVDTLPAPPGPHTASVLPETPSAPVL